MKEQEPNELTSQPNSSNLKSEGEIFMPEGNNGGPEHEEPKKLEGTEPSGTPPEDQRRERETNAPDSSNEHARMEDTIARNALARAVEYNKVLAPLREMLGNPEVRQGLIEAGIPIDDPEKILQQAFDFTKLEQAAQQRQRAAAKEGQPIYVPESLEELSVLVMDRATPEYRKGGEKCLLNYKKDKEGKDTDIVESVNTVNFLDWARNNYYLVHLNNPTAPVNFFSDIATNIRSQGIGSTISFYEISFTDSYYLKEVKDEQGNVIDRVENSEYKTLKSQMLMEVFLLQLQRNPAVSYVLQSRGEREKMLNALAEALATNPLTRSNFFETIFSQPSMHGQSIYDLDSSVKDKGELEKKIEGNFLMGDATREALAAYINIFDYKQLVKILGADSPLFMYEYEDWNALSGKPNDGLKKTAVDTTDPEKREKEWFKDGKPRLYAVETSGRHKGRYKRDADGNLIDDSNGQPHPDYMKYLNIFLTPAPDQRQQDEIRERIRLSIMKRNGISYREAQIAELMAYSMTHINGIAARGDTDSVGFDWWTRVTNFLDKRKREKSPKRNAPYGSKFNMEGFKRIGLNIFETVRDVRNRSLRDIIQGGTGSNIDIKGNPLKNDVDYERDENGLIIFFDPQTGKEAAGIRAKNHEVVHVNKIEEVVDKDEKKTTKEVIKTNVVFTDGNDRIVDTGKYMAKVKEPKKVENPVEFKQAIQQGFLVNHLATGSKIYEWIMHKKELELPNIVTGYDTHQNPIVNWEKINEIKGGIEHDFRYLLSTWGEINYGERNVEWEMIEVRDEQGSLLSKDGDRLDEDWYVLDEKGNRTDRRADPETFLRSREMSRLENMFGADALKYIQFEIKRKGLEFSKLKGVEKKDSIVVADAMNKEQVEVDISAASSKKEAERREFAIAVWQGAWEYLVAAEIEAHRTRGSGDEYYDADKTLRAKDALKVGQILDSDQIKNIAKQTDTGTIRVLRQDIGYAFATGGLEGGWKLFQIILKDILSGK